MATKKNSQAEKAVSDAKKKSSNSKSGASKKSAGSSANKSPKVSTEYDRVFSTDTIIAIVSLGLFIFFLLTAINPEGVLPKIVLSVMLGLLGKVGFYFLIPGTLYIFLIFTFGRKTKVHMRGLCVLLFILSCGCIYHLTQSGNTISSGIAAIGDLYSGGGSGATGGVLCGLIAIFLRWICGTAVAYILLGISACLALLGSMQITIFSLAKAIKNRPRDEETLDDGEEDIDPAALVVNHIANRRIEHSRQRRQRMEQSQQPIHIEEDFDSDLPPELPAATPVTVIPATPAKNPPRKQESPQAVAKTANMMNQIDEIGSPVSAAAEHISDPVASRDLPAVLPKKNPKASSPAEDMDQAIPSRMPELLMDDPIPAAPKMESAAGAANVPPKKLTAKDTVESAMQVAAEIQQNQAQPKSMYCFPPIDLLNRPTRGSADGTAEMKENSRRLNETLASFKIDAHIINVTRGPSVTRYEVELDKGVRLNKLTSCADDIALSLGASGVRVAAVPDKISTVGIEVPNRAITTVSLREVIDSPEFHKSKSKSSFAVGKDIGGSSIVGNIRKMPHMLIAGTTGSGKSVCMNSIIISLLYKASPDDVKLIMVDPKMVELGIYNGIPHLLIPVVTDPKKAAGSLQWAVTEMLRRYKLMSDVGVRDLEAYNAIMESEQEGEGKLPQVVIIVDELADLMLVAAKEVEDSICRIAQMGRASGMHLIIATQRPSADVITGLMKANIPSRIAFSVASAMESRIILDTQGAEKLVGKGDMLYAPIGCGKPLRVQGCFVTDGEVENVASYVKEHYVANYDQEVLEEIERKAQLTGKKPVAAPDPEPNAQELDGDEMLPAAVDVILETGQASVSMLQRRLKLGYARAARIVDEMEEKGIVGPFQGSKPRSILITKEAWEAQKNAQPLQLEFSDMEDAFDGVPEEI